MPARAAINRSDLLIRTREGDHAALEALPCGAAEAKAKAA